MRIARLGLAQLRRAVPAGGLDAADQERPPGDREGLDLGVVLGAADAARVDDLGVEAGRGLIDAVVREESLDRWTPEAFETLVLGKRFRDLGIPVEVLSRSGRRLEFRHFTCPFLELAEEMPSLVCDALDDGFHAGMGAAIGGLRTERIACMGHGDRYCQYRLTWEGGERARRKAKARRVRRHIEESRT